MLFEGGSLHVSLLDVLCVINVAKKEPERRRNEALEKEEEEGTIKL